MKIFLKITGLFVLFITLGCGSNDDDGTTPPEMETPEDSSLLGVWELVSGDFIEEDVSFIFIKNDATFETFFEDQNGFRKRNLKTYVLTETQIELNLGSGTFTLIDYSINEDILILSTALEDQIIFTRSTESNTISWTSKIQILEQGTAPWNGAIDIAYRADQILLGNGNTSNGLGIINTTSITLEDEIPITEETYAIEIEKFDVPDKYIFTSDIDASIFQGYFENTLTLEFTSDPIGSQIKGIASISGQSAWIYSNTAQSLFKYNYGDSNNHIIEEEIDLEIHVDGLDYQNELLYICSEGFIYKCQTNPSFMVLESIEIEGHSIYGIAFDGINFWVNAASIDSENNQIMKTSLTL